MKKFLCGSSFLFILILIQDGLYAQNMVNFVSVRNSTQWDEVISESYRTSKPIFVDVYTDWCGYCKKMDKDVFADGEVSTFLNTYFVNVKLDGETEFGKGFGFLHEVEGFPTYLYLDKKNNAFGYLEGYVKKSLFLSSTEAYLERYKLIADYDRKFAVNQISDKELAEYYGVTGDRDRKQVVFDRLYSKLSETELISKDYFGFFKASLGEVNDKTFQVLSNNKEALIANYGNDEFGELVSSVYQNTLAAAISKNDESLIESITVNLLPLNWDDESLKIVTFNTRKLFYAYTDNWATYEEVVDSELVTLEDQLKGNFLYNEGLQLINEYKDSDQAIAIADKWLINSVKLGDDFESNVLLAYVKVLLSNFQEAEKWLLKAEELAKGDDDQVLLADVRMLVDEGLVDR